MSDPLPRSEHQSELPPLHPSSLHNAKRLQQETARSLTEAFWPSAASYYISAIRKPKSAALPSSPKTFGIILLRILVTFCLVVTSSTAASEGWKCSRGYIG